MASAVALVARGGAISPRTGRRAAGALDRAAGGRQDAGEWWEDPAAAELPAGQLPPALETSTLNVAAHLGENRRAKFQVRRALGVITQYKRIRSCGYSLAPDRSKLGNGDAAERKAPGEVKIKRGGSGVAHYSGLMRCGLGSVCPVCAAKIADHRAKELERVLSYHMAHGGGGAFTTLTLPHGAPDRLEKTMRVAMAAFRAILQSRAFRELRRELNVTGYVRRLEITHGATNGWHPHLHIIILTARALSDRQLSRLHAYLFGAWRDYVSGAGLRTPQPYCSDTTQLAGDTEYLAIYLAKMSKELNRWDLKTGRRGGRSPFELLDGAIAGSVKDQRLWKEYEKAVYRVRMISYSRGLKRDCAVVDCDDLSIVQREEGGVDVATIRADTWQRIRKLPDLLALLLELAEADDLDLLKTMIESLEYGLPDATADPPQLAA